MEEGFRSRFIPRLREQIEVEVVVQEPGLLLPGMTSSTPRQKPWGTGHAVLVARGAVDTPFVVVNADDYYGTNAFTKLGRCLIDSTVTGRPKWYLVGYRVKKTLSKHGPVSRGICEVDSRGYLLGITERRGIEVGPDGYLHYLDGVGSHCRLAGDEVVSMNLFGFTQSLFPLLAERFRQFVKTLRGDDEAELFLPSVVNAAISTGRARVQALPTAEEWIGVTYREDSLSMREHIIEAIENGKYPSRLW
jgi:hypothetical protein